MKENIMVIDAEGIAAGRLSSYVAKELLKGKTIAVINTEKSIISGNKKDIETKFEERRTKLGGLLRGPKIHRNPEKVLKRMIRGMIPRKRPRGQEVFKNVKCYNGMPKEFENEKVVKLERKGYNKYVKLGEIYKK